MKQMLEGDGMIVFANILDLYEEERRCFGK
jgi:hypothetical protein